MFPGFHWGRFTIQWFLAVLFFVPTNIIVVQKGVCAEACFKILQIVSFFQQSKFQFQYSYKVACCEPMSHWPQSYSPGEESK